MIDLSKLDPESRRQMLVIEQDRRITDLENKLTALENKPVKPTDLSDVFKKIAAVEKDIILLKNGVIKLDNKKFTLKSLLK